MLSKQINMNYFEYINSFTLEQHWTLQILSELEGDIQDYMRPKNNTNK